MAYIGVSPSNGVRQKHTYTATASQTTFSGAGAEGVSLSYRDSNYVDVYRNGVKLGDADYTATSGTSIVLGEGAAVSDIVEIVVYDVFSVADTVSKADGGVFDGNVTMAGTLAVTGVLTGTSLDISGDIDIDGTTNLDVVDIDGTLNVQGETTLQTHLNMGDNDIIKLGDSADLQIYHDASNSIIKDTGTGNLQLYAGLRHQFFNADGSSTYAQFVGDGGAGTEYVQLRYANSTKLATTSTGIDVTGGFTATDGCTITTADNTAQLTLISTDADSNFGPLLTMYRNSSSPADADFLGNIEFQGENSAGETITYAQVFGRTGDVTDGTEDGRIATKIMIAGASQNVLDIKSDEIVINDDSVDLDFRVESNNNANMLFVDGGNDRVGIGTSSPNAILHVNGSADNVVNIQVQNTEGTGSRLDMYAFGSSPAIQSAHRAAVYQWTGSGIDLWSRVGDLHFGTNNSERMRIDSSGNLLVGTTNSDIGGSVTGIRLSESGSILASTDETDNIGNTPYYGDRRGTNNTGDILSLALGGYLKASIGVLGTSSSPNDGGITFNTISGNTTKTERVRINSSGYVGIGSNSPSEPLLVYNADFNGAVLRAINTRDTSNANGIKVTIGVSGGASGTNSAHFHGNTNAVGNWYLYANGTTSYSSDERLKKNIETTRDGYLEDLAKLRVVKYNWNCDKDGDNKELGLIAQEVEKVFPNLVKDDTNPISEDDPTMYKQLKQSVLPMMLLKALQEANTKITALEARIEALENA
jgi:cytoskeletal protein CcmA (bactofilin family)